MTSLQTEGLRYSHARTLPFVVDRESPVPLYHQLSSQLREAIDREILQPGERIEAELVMAARLRLSRPTVRRAIEDLTNEGLLIRRRGAAGTTVAPRPARSLEHLNDLFDDQSELDRGSSTQLLRLDPAARNDMAAKAFQVDSNTPFTYIERLRSTRSGPTAILKNWLPAGLLDVHPIELSRRGLYELLRARRVRLSESRQHIGGRAPTPGERLLLHLDASDSVLTVTRRSYDSSGTPIEFGLQVCRLGSVHLDITTRAS